MLSLVLALAVSQAPTASNSRVVRVDRIPGVRTPGGRKGVRGYAFFEFAPSGGAGMGAPCACTTPTGAKGEALTFTRASNGTCTKTTTGGLTTTGIANGDLVVCSSNQPRVEYDSQGVLGLLVESSRTNSALRSQELDNAAWVKAGVGGGSAPTVTADFAVAPDGTTTAERVQFSACATTADASILDQNITASSPGSVSFYARANAGTPSISVCTFGATSGSRACTQFALSTSSWTRLTYANQTWVGAVDVTIGCENRTASYSGATNTGAADVLLWGGQLEGNASYVTSYIPTVAAAVTRATETPATFGPQTFGITTNKVSVAFSMADVAGTAAQVPILMQNVVEIFSTRPTYQVYHYPAATFFGTLTIPASGVNRFATAADGTNRTNCMNGTCESTSVVSTNFASSPWTLTIGGEGAAKPVDSIISRICVDPDPSRCR